MPRNDTLPRCRLPLLLLVFVCISSACTTAGGGEKEALRFELEQTKAALAESRREQTELRAHIRELTAELDASSGERAAEVIEATPRAAELAFERLTSLFDRDESDGFEGIDVYLRPLDGRGRFVQVAGNMRVQAFLEPAEASGERLLLDERLLGPSELRAAYRSTLLSVHYAVRLELTPPLPLDIADRPGNGTVLILARFDDAITGLSHTAQRTLK